MKKLFEINNIKKAVNKAVTQKINLNVNYCIINNRIKLIKIINVVTTNNINEQIKKIQRLSIVYLNCDLIIFKSDLECNWDD